MRLITFGDSWTAGHGVETNVYYKEKAFPDKFTQKLREQNSWPKWVAQKLDIPYVNLGVCGFGNEYILKELSEIKNMELIEQDDIIIVMFSYPYRYTADTYNVIEIYHKIESKLKDYKHFFFNSFYPTFKEENFDTTKLPDYFINPNGCVADILKEYEIKNNISIWEYGSRSVWNDEKNYWEGDYHPNELGYKIIGEYIYDEIKRRI
jgi:lysophospholipase L1-like esterase